MAIRFFPFDSVNGDRIYTAQDFSAFVSGQISDGVVLGNVGGTALKVVSTTGLQVTVSLGKAFVQGRYFELFQTAQNVAIGANSSGSNRVDRIVIRLDFVNRTMTIAAKQGTTVAPSLTRNASIWEISLASVTIAHLAASIPAANIFDERNDLFLCGRADPASQVEGFQNIPNSGWRRIAVTNGVAFPAETGRFNQANARFFIGTDDFGTTIQDQMFVEVSITNGIPTIAMTSRTKNTGVFLGIRVVAAPSSKDAALEINLASTAKVTFVILDNFADNGWKAVNWDAGNAVGLDITEINISGSEIFAMNGNQGTTPFKIFQNGTFTSGGVSGQLAVPQGALFDNNQPLQWKDLLSVPVTTNILNGSDVYQTGNPFYEKQIRAITLPKLDIAGDTSKRSTFHLEQLPAARTQKWNNQAFPTGVLTTVTWDGEVFDTDNILDLVASASNFTVKTAGIYTITGAMAVATSVAGTLRDLRILKNGTTVAHVRHAPINSTNVLSISTVIDAAVNDVFVLAFFHDAGVSLNVAILTNVPYMAMAMTSGNLTMPV